MAQQRSVTHDEVCFDLVGGLIRLFFTAAPHELAQLLKDFGFCFRLFTLPHFWSIAVNQCKNQSCIKQLNLYAQPQLPLVQFYSYCCQILLHLLIVLDIGQIISKRHKTVAI